jgi:hypothetical protein
MRQPVQVHRPGEQARVPELTPGAAAQEPPQLRRGELTAPLRLPLQAAERAEIALRINERLDPGSAGRADQLVLQILDADVKAQALHVRPRPRRPDAGPGQTAPEHVLLAKVTQARQPQASPGGTEPRQVARHRVSAADRQDHHAFRAEVPAVAHGQRLDRDLVADPLHKHDGPRGRHFHQCPGRGLGRSRRAMHIAIDGRRTGPGPRAGAVRRS